MNIVVLMGGAAVVWVGQAIGLSRLMGRRGFHPLPWFAVSMLLGPAMWPLAVVELISGPPGPELLRRGSRGPGALEIGVVFGSNEIPEETAVEIRRLMPNCRRLVLGRVIKAGGPTFVAADAKAFLERAASHLGTRGAELQLLRGDMERVIGKLNNEGNYDLVLRSDQPNEPFDGHGSIQEMRCLRDVHAA